MRERILITGPGGRVGTQIIPLLREHFSLRLLDVKPLPAEADDETVQADIRDFDGFNRAYSEFFRGIRPARTTVQSGLGGGIKVEIDAIARVRG